MAADEDGAAMLEAARHTPLPTLNYIGLLHSLLGKILGALGPAGHVLLLPRLFLRLLRLLTYLPKRDPKGSTEQRTFSCHCQATFVLMKLSHHFRDHPSRHLLMQMVQQLKEHVVLAIVNQLSRPEVWKALHERHISMDIDLATNLALGLLKARGKYLEAEHLRLLRHALPELEAGQVHRILLEAENAGPSTTSKVLRHLVLKLDKPDRTEEDEVVAVSAILRHGFKQLPVQTALELLFMATSTPWLKAAARLALDAITDSDNPRATVDYFDSTQQQRLSVLPQLDELFDEEARASLLSLLNRANRVFQQHRLKGKLSNPFSEAEMEEKGEPGVPGWMVPDAPAVPPAPANPAPRRFQIVMGRDPCMNEAAWDALEIPDHGLVEHMRRWWHLLASHNQRRILLLLTHHVLVTIASQVDNHKILALEMVILQAVLEFGPDCLNTAQQIELMVAASRRPPLQARLLCAWVRLSPERRLRLPRLLQVLPACLRKQQWIDYLNSVLPTATKEALENFLQAAHASVPEDVFRSVDYYTDGASSYAPEVGHTCLREVAWREAGNHEVRKVLFYTEAVCEEPYNAVPLQEQSSVLLSAPQLLSDKQLINEASLVMPLVDQHQGKNLLEFISYRAGCQLLESEQPPPFDFAAKAFRLLSERGQRFLAPPLHLELLILVCGDLFKQAQLLTLWTRLSRSRQKMRTTAIKLWASALKHKGQSSEDFSKLAKSFAQLVPEESVKIVTEADCAKAHATLASKRSNVLLTRKAIIDVVWKTGSEAGTFSPTVAEMEEESAQEQAQEQAQEEAQEEAQQGPQEAPQEVVTPKKKQPVQKEAPQPPPKRRRSAKRSRRKLFSAERVEPVVAPELEQAPEQEQAPEPVVAQEPDEAPEQDDHPELDVAQEPVVAPELEQAPEPVVAHELDGVPEQDDAPELDVAQEPAVAQEPDEAPEQDLAQEPDEAPEQDLAQEPAVAQEPDEAPEQDLAQEPDEAPEQDDAPELDEAPELGLAQEHENPAAEPEINMEKAELVSLLFQGKCIKASGGSPFATEPRVVLLPLDPALLQQAADEQQVESQSVVRRSRRITAKLSSGAAESTNPSSKKRKVGPRPEVAEAPEPTTRSSRLKAAEKRRRSKADCPTTNKRKAVRAAAPQQAEASSPGRNASKASSKRAAAKPSGPAAKKAKAAHSPDAEPVALRPRREAAKRAATAISYCYEAFRLNKRPCTWEHFRQLNGFCPPYAYVNVTSRDAEEDEGVDSEEEEEEPGDAN